MDNEEDRQKAAEFLRWAADGNCKAGGWLAQALSLLGWTPKILAGRLGVQQWEVEAWLENQLNPGDQDREKFNDLADDLETPCVTKNQDTTK